MSDADFPLSPPADPGAWPTQAPSLGGTAYERVPSDAPSLGGEAALARLIDALRNTDSGVRERAAEALGNVYDGRAVDLLLEAMVDRSASVRMRAAHALGNIFQAGYGNYHIRETLIAALRDDAAGVRRSAAQSLGRIGGADLVSELLVALRDHDPGVQRASAETLGLIGMELPDRALRVQITRALLDLASRTQYHLYQSELRPVVAGAIARLGEGSIPVLQEALDRYNRSSEVAAEALGMICCQTPDRAARVQIVMTLLSAAWEPDVLLAQKALAVLGTAAPQLQDAHLLDRVITELLDLALATGPMTVELRDCLPDTIIRAQGGRTLDVLRPSVIGALGRFGEVKHETAERVLPALIEATFDDERLVRFEAIMALGRIATHYPEAAAPAAPALIRRLSDAAPWAVMSRQRVCDVAAHALRLIGAPEALEALAHWQPGLPSAQD